MTKKEFIQNIGKGLKKKREDANVTQQEMAIKTGLCQTTISRIESGKHNFGICVIHNYMVALNININFD